MMTMKEANLAMQALEELNRRECNGHVKFRLGLAHADPDRFQRVFKRFSRGTYFEETAVQIETVEPVVSCGCGYRRQMAQGSYLHDASCPRCGGRLEFEHGHEFEILEPQQRRKAT